jgi:hypothetical protein
MFECFFLLFFCILSDKISFGCLFSLLERGFIV